MTPAHIANQKKHANNVATPSKSSSSPGGSWQNQEQGTPLMCRLAARVGPPSGFWEKSRNSNKIVQPEWKSCNFDHTRYNIAIAIKNTQKKKLPLPRIPC